MKTNQHVSITNQYIKQALDISRLMIVSANDARTQIDDEGCLALFEVVRDCAFKIRSEAEREKQVHITNGIWEESAMDSENQPDS